MPTAATAPASARRDSALALAERLYLEARQRLLAIARANCAGGEDAEEALHDALVLFIERFDPECASPPLPWLMLTLKRRCWAIYRRRRELGEALGRAAAQRSAPGTEHSVEELAESAERAARLGRDIRLLGPEERRALGLVAVGCSYREIAARLGWTPKRVDRCLQRARAKLRGAEKTRERAAPNHIPGG